MTDHQERPGEPLDAAPPSPELLPAPATDLTDGNWHRLHPASPLLRGGIALLAILGVVLANLRERLIEIFFPTGFESDDPFDLLLETGYLPWFLAGIAAVLLVLILGFYISWRMHSFRVTEEVVEVRSGIVFRTNRKARLDRIQGINISRPFIARLFGAAKLEINQAGNDANVELTYLGSAHADDLRRDILLLASGTRRAERAAETPAAGGTIEQRVSEFLAPELDPNAAPPESVVKLNPGRLLGSIVLSEGTIFLLLLIIGAIVGVFTTGEIYPLFAIVPAILGLGGYLVSKFLRSLRYSIAATPDGVRVGFGLLSTTNSTLPPGRIHSVQLSQSLLWRPFGWWQLKVNRASRSSARGAAGEQNTTILPVGDAGDVARVLDLLLPDVADREVIALALSSKGAVDGFTISPARARVVRWFSRLRNGFAKVPGGIVLRRGAIWRDVIVVPDPRLQSVALEQGPLARSLRIAAVRLHTVDGPIFARIGAIDQDDAVRFFGDVATVVVDAGRADRSHRWREHPA
ncbi:PH domain-containing protein [Cryobacterium sp. BB307]|uniref:PH domain-containing protein n=1 Tax=Cryobacterium sp. BB307 TaxID=2716317 RepID=UPI001446279A